MIHFDQVAKEEKSVFIFEKWPLVAELTFKMANIAYFWTHIHWFLRWIHISKSADIYYVSHGHWTASAHQFYETKFFLQNKCEVIGLGKCQNDVIYETFLLMKETTIVIWGAPKVSNKYHKISDSEKLCISTIYFVVWLQCYMYWYNGITFRHKGW